MKKWFIPLLIAAICLLSLTAMAEDVTGQGSIVARNDGLAAYLDGNGRLMIPGNDSPVNNLRADSIISIDSYRLVFLSKTNAGTEQESSDLVCIEFSDFEESILATGVHAACMAEQGKLYYIQSANRNVLKLLDFDTGAHTDAYVAAEQLDCLYVSAEGLVATHVENAGAVMMTATGSFETFAGSIPSQNQLTPDYQLYIANGSELYLFRADSFAADMVDANVFSFALIDGKVYYLADMGSAMRLKSYAPDTMEWKVLSTPDVSLDWSLTASDKHLFVMGTDHVIYDINLANGELQPFAAIQNSYAAIPAGGSWQVDSYHIEAMSGQLNLYATLSEKSAAPTFSFMEFSSDLSETSNKKKVLLETFVIRDEEQCWAMLEPAEQFTPLARGNRGEAVRAIQQPLLNLGYYDYIVDGIFGSRTDRAVRLLQGDLGRIVNGIADEELQRLILSGKLAPYDPYRAVNYGDRGLRTQMLQQRLRAYGYLADTADGIYGNRTREAVRLFQWENGLPMSDNATRETLIALYSDNVSHCTSYIPLRKGDSGSRVRELNKRLVELFYLESNPGSTYTSATADAIRRFQSQVGLAINGQASVALQQRLFSRSAPEYTGYIVLKRGDENSRVYRLQRRLKELNYLNAQPNGYFGKRTQEAVKLFQQKVGMRPTGEASIRMQELLFSPNAPRYVKPTVISKPVISISAYEKFENGVYCLTDRCSETGSVTFSWVAEGDVASYNILITDNSGKEYLNQNTLMTMTGVSIDTLVMNRNYTLRVTAYPKDGDSKHVTSAVMNFRRIETPKEPEEVVIGTIAGVHASVEPVVSMANDVYYVRPGTITFRWYADGDVASYYVEIRDPANGLCLNTTTTDEQASITTDSMAVGEVYTLSVYAIPTNGTMNDAVLKTMRFALENEPEPLPSVSAPAITADELQPVGELNGKPVYTIGENAVTFRWNNVENASQYYIEIHDAANAYLTGETTTASGYVLNPTMLSKGASYTLSVTAIPEGGTVTEEATATVILQTEEDKTVVQLDAPVLSIANAQPSSDGIVYLDDSSAIFQWTSVNGAAGYNVVVRDSSQNSCFEMTVTDLSLDYSAGDLTRGAVYTVTVTAIPDESVNGQGTPATIPFIIRVPETTPEPVPVPAPETDPELPVELGAPQITISVIDEIVNSVVYVQEGTVSFNWYSEDAVSGYYAAIYDANGTLCVEQTTMGQEGSVNSNSMIPGAVYTIRVIALPADGNAANGAVSEVRFARKGTETENAESAINDAAAAQPAPIDDEYVEESIPEVPVESVVEAPAVEESVIEEPTVEEPAIEEPVVEEPVVVPNVVSVPVLDIQPAIGMVDSVILLQEGTVSFNWYSEGNLEGYYAEIINAYGGVEAELATSDTAAQISSANLTPGEIYTLRVTAIPAGEGMESGAVSTMQFMLEQPVVEEPAIEEPIIEEPVIEEPVIEEPVVEEPVIEEPAIEEPVVEEPVIEEPVVEEPVVVPNIVSAPVLDIQPAIGMVDSVILLQEGTVSFNWYSEGNLEGYYAEIINAYGGVEAEVMTGDTYAQIPSSNLVPGEVYTLRVTAIPAGEGMESGVTASVQFMLDMPVVVPEPVPEPIPEPVDEYIPEPEPYEESIDEYIPEPESYEEPVDEYIPEPEPVEEPAAENLWTEPVGMNSSPELITAIQQRLVEWGWLSADSFSNGSMDDATVSAIAEFQNAYAASSDVLPEFINYETRTIDVVTLTLLMADDALPFFGPVA